MAYYQQEADLIREADLLRSQNAELSRQLKEAKRFISEIRDGFIENGMRNAKLVVEQWMSNNP